MNDEGRISVVEDIMIEAIKSLLPDVNVDTRPISLSESELAKLIGMAPFVFIEYNGAHPVSFNEDGSVRSYKPAFNLFVAAKSLRSKQHAQRGSYGMLAAILSLLNGHVLVDSEDSTRRTGKFNWEGDDILMDLPGGTIYQAVYSMAEGMGN